MLGLGADLWGQLLQGAGMTLLLTFISTVLGFFLALLTALGRKSRHPVARSVAGSYVEVFRNTPFFVQLLFIFFGLPALGIQLSEVQAALLAMTLNLGAYTAEIVRAGLNAIGAGQMEAAVSLGLRPAQVFRDVVLKQAVAKVYPALVSQILIVMLGSAVVSYISVHDLTYATQLIASRNFQQFTMYGLIAVLYLLIAVGIRGLLRAAGRRVFAFQQTSS